MRTIVLATIFAVLAGICGRSACAQTVDQVAPQVKATGYVTDLAGVLSQSGREQLTALCTEVSQKTQAEIAVVTIRSLDDQPIEDYSHTLAERLGLGPKGQGRGVLILFSTSDHKDRIEVGYTLEPILPDGKVGDFLREAIPDLRANNYDAALYLVTRRVADVIAADKGVTLTGAALAPQESFGGRRNSPIGQFASIVFTIFIVFVVFRLLGGGGGPRGGRGSSWWIWPLIGMSMGRGGWGGGGFGGGGGGGGGGGFGGFGGGGF
ncbi:MAG: TPM domain-containing protein, partial [Xanthobacteraceae bacterium]